MPHAQGTPHVKKFHNNDNNDTTNLEPSVPRKTNDIRQELAEPVTPVPMPMDPTPPTRPQRVRNVPEKLKDYIY